MVFVVILVTFIRDIRRGASRDYHLAIASIVIAMIAALIEMVSVYFVVSLSGIFIGSGLVILLVLNIIRTVQNVRMMEHRRQKKVLDDRRRQTERISLQTIKTLSTTVETKNLYSKAIRRELRITRL